MKSNIVLLRLSMSGSMWDWLGEDEVYQYGGKSILSRPFKQINIHVKPVLVLSLLLIETNALDFF